MDFYGRAIPFNFDIEMSRRLNIALKAGCCAVCGSTPTVHSHIIPRALAKDLRANEKHLVAGDLWTEGPIFMQAGRGDPDLLCRTHEAQLGPIDDYGIRFLRRAREALVNIAPGRYVTISNRDPRLLQAFVLSVVWRKDLSNQTRDNSHSNLGPYGEKIRRLIFEGAALNSPILFIKSHLTVGGELAPMLIEPMRTLAAGRHAWTVGFGWISAIVKLDNRAWPENIERHDASRTKNVSIHAVGPVDLLDAEGLHPVLAQMLKGDKPD